MITSLRGTDEIAAVQRRIQNRRIGGRSKRSEMDTEFLPPARQTSPRRKVERRKLIDPTTCERDYTLQEVEFMKAMDEYKRKSGRMFPTWSEVLEVVRGLGYEQKSDAVTV